MSDLTIQELEHDHATRHPQTTRVDAYLTANEDQWLFKCPRCGLLHYHGYDGTFASAGLRVPHCEDGAKGERGYYLIPAGTLSRRMENEMRRLDQKRRLYLRREANRLLAAEIAPFRRKQTS